MILKDTIFLEEPEEEESPPYDEVDDLLELLACIEPVNGVESEIDADSTEEEVSIPLAREHWLQKRLKP